MECAQRTIHRVETWSEREALLWVDAPDMAAQAKPGQFVMVQSVPASTFLKKAISIHGVQENLLGLAVQKVGPGTEALTALSPGDKVSLIGPLGNGFTLPETPSRLLMVAGGIGKAPFRMLAEHALEKGHEVVLVAGGRDEAALAGLEWADDLGVSMRLATEDGSLGHRGFVTDLMTDAADFSVLYACGPTPMLRAVQQLALAKDRPCELSLEGKMACGVGVCLGCTVARANGDAPYLKVCTDGPVFLAEEVRL